MWPTEKVLLLIEDFHSASCLWDVTNPDYKNRTKKKIVIEELAKKYEVSVGDVEKKIHNLKTAFHREHKKINQAKKSGVSPVKNAWFAYEHLLFLLQGSESRGSRSTDCNEEENSESGIIEDDSFISEYENHRNEDPKVVESDPPLFKKPNHSNKRIKINTVSPIQEAVSCMKSLASSRDEYTVFGELIAEKLRNCDRSKLEKSIAQHNIHSVILRLEMGMYADQVPSGQPTATSSSSMSIQSNPSESSSSCISSPRSQQNQEYTEHGVSENIYTYLNTLNDL